MTKIYPSEIRGKELEESASTTATSLTVWKKSSMSFVGTDGFSAYDGEGRLAFRVDNYSRRSKYLLGELVLMDAVGKPLFHLRPKFLSMHDEWRGYKGDAGSDSAPHFFSMRRRSLVQRKGEQSVDVFMRVAAKAADLRIEGCFRKRCCKILGREGQLLARISPKKASQPSVALGGDVFELCVEAGVAAELVMAFIVIMDRIC
ncbi:hypothetical protein HPP92_022600 [Vanilla planifolia]|uniref:Uncharacterized protein n=1 Tax=Vanilla planifolia TaxID=51239 RepID=A0A835UF87_VANPL|nr:hypothetical protein HPP92_022600 [Vanilla planifolia]